MGLKGKLIHETEIKSSAHKYYNLMKAQAHHFPTITPDRVSAITLHEGDWHVHGALRRWNYVKDGKAETVIEKIEHCGPLTVSLDAMEGDVLTNLKHFKTIFQAIPAGPGGGCDKVRFTAEYEKRKESDAAPVDYLDLLSYIFIEDLDAYLVKQGN